MLSIIICTLNEEHYLPKLLDSLTNQTATFAYEVLVIDAGSADNTEGVARQYEKNGTFPLQFVAFNQRGIARQRNEGAKRAKYEHLLFLDADVVLDSDFLDCAMAQITAKNLQIAGTKLYAAEKSWRFRATFWYYSNVYLPIMRLFKPVINGCSIFVTKKIHDQIGGFKEEILFEDYRYGVDAAAIFRPPLLRGRAYVRTSARRFYDISPRIFWELMKSGFYSFYKAGMDKSQMKTYEKIQVIIVDRVIKCLVCRVWCLESPQNIDNQRFADS